MDTPNFPLFFCVTLNILNVLDVVSTLYGLRIGLREGNPYFHSGMIPLKMIAVLLYSVFVTFSLKFAENCNVSFGIRFFKMLMVVTLIAHSVTLINNLIHILLVR